MREVFWGQFDTVEEYGESEIENLASIIFDDCKDDDIKVLTDLIMVINHKSWDHHQWGNDILAKLYADLYYEYYERAIDYLENENREEDLRYFIRTLD